MNKKQGRELPAQIAPASATEEEARQRDEAQKNERAWFVSWCNHTLDAAQWLAHVSVTPEQAAMLLFAFNPHETQLDQAKAVTNDERMGPEDFRRLLAVLEDWGRAHPGDRRLLDWADTAKARGLPIHTWLGRYLEYGPHVVEDWGAEAERLRYAARDTNDIEERDRLDRNAVALASDARLLRAALQMTEPDSRQSGEPGGAAPAIDEDLLATPGKLTEVFGRYTGMEASWFKRLADKPGLKAARRVLGAGQRGGRRPPLFCPFEVMRWLLSDKRKCGRKFESEDTAWRLLEDGFPRVYAKYSAADSRAEQAG